MDELHQKENKIQELVLEIENLETTNTELVESNSQNIQQLEEVIKMQKDRINDLDFEANIMKLKLTI